MNVANRLLRILKRYSITHPLHRRLANILLNWQFDCVKPENVYYNETSNDRWIVEYLLPNRKNGFFVEAGAANGVDGSSCYVLEKALGWRGICIEPNEFFFKELVNNRPNANCQRVCLSERSGKEIYIQSDETSLNAYFNGLKSSLERYKYKGDEAIKNGKEVIVDTITLEELLDKCRAPRVIDYAAFDIEGSEFTVLKGFPFDKYTFLAVSIECDGGSVWEFFTRFFAANGYREVRNPFNRDKFWERYWIHKSVR